MTYFHVGFYILQTNVVFQQRSQWEWIHILFHKITSLIHSQLAQQRQNLGFNLTDSLDGVGLTVSIFYSMDFSFFDSLDRVCRKSAHPTGA